jgi:hypothetical protein
VEQPKPQLYDVMMLLTAGPSCTALTSFAALDMTEANAKEMVANFANKTLPEVLLLTDGTCAVVTKYIVAMRIAKAPPPRKLTKPQPFADDPDDPDDPDDEGDDVGGYGYEFGSKNPPWGVN